MDLTAAVKFPMFLSRLKQNKNNVFSASSPNLSEYWRSECSEVC